MSVTNERSIFSSSTGRRRRWASDDQPVPKSSSEIRTPRRAIASNVAAAPSGSASRPSSVTSRASDVGGTSWRGGRGAPAAGRAGGGRAGGGQGAGGGGG